MNPRAVIKAPFEQPLTNPLSAPWVAFFQGLFTGAQPQGGTTALRPTNPVLYQPYFDTTLGKPIWCKQISPSVTWVDATGASV